MSLYQDLGVDAGKGSVRIAFGKVINNHFPGAFVNIIRDPDVPGQVLTQHQDGDGSKLVHRLLHYDEVGNPTIFAGGVDDALAMNGGDVAASGFVFGKWLVTDVLNLCLDQETKEEVMKVIAQRFWELQQLYAAHGIIWYFLGGETADLPDQVRSAVFDISLTAWEREENLVLGNVRPGDVIYGFASDGQATWETEANSGIMSNGLTLARSCLLRSSYNHLMPKLKREGDFYRGHYYHDETPEILGGLTISQAILSPTRQWPILIKQVMLNLKEVGASQLLHGLTLNTGGGATKIGHLGNGGVCYRKSLPEEPPIFSLIQKESGETWKNMFRTFNMGIGIDVVGEDNPVFQTALEKASVETNIACYRLGSVTENTEAKKNKVVLATLYGEWEY